MRLTDNPVSISAQSPARYGPNQSLHTDRVRCDVMMLVLYW